MATDQVILGGFTLDGFAAPQVMVGGGRQAMAVHKLPGGSRVIDVLGPDDAEIPIAGQLYADNAYSTCLALDSLRAAGTKVSLIWGGQFKTVIVEDFHFIVHRYPNWCDYSITCLVVSNPSQGLLSSAISTVTSLVSSDLTVAMSIS